MKIFETEVMPYYSRYLKRSINENINHSVLVNENYLNSLRLGRRVKIDLSVKKLLSSINLQQRFRRHTRISDG